MPTKNLKERPSDKNIKHRFISLTLTSGCNLACRYCYEKHELRDKKIMDFSLAKKIITHYMEEKDSDFLDIDFFGGEPMMAFELIRDTMDWFHTISWNKGYRFHICTNGTILNDEIKNWLLKNKNFIQLGISIDGTKTAHDLCRSNSYDLLAKNLPFFTKYWPEQPAKMTICADTIPYAAQGVIELEEMGLLFTANLSFENQWGDDDNKNRLLGIYEEQLSQLVDYYVDRPHLYPIRLLLTSVPEYLGIPSLGEKKPKVIKRFCGAGHEMVVIDVDGNKYPCHRFIPWITNRPAPKESVNCQTAWKPEECAQCKLILSCPTCAGFNWEVNGDTGIRTTYHCEFYKTEVMASCLLEWKRLKKRLENFNMLSIEDKLRVKRRMDAIGILLDNGI